MLNILNLLMYRATGAVLIALGIFWRFSNYGENHRVFYLWPAGAFGLFIVVSIVREIIKKIVSSSKRDQFWLNHFLPNFETLLAFIGLGALSLFLRNNYIFLVYLLSLGLAFILYLRYLLGFHTYPHLKNVFTIIVAVLTFLFTINITFQFVNFSYYILESQRNIPNVVVLRALGMTLIWGAAFAIAGIWYWFMPKRIKNLLLYVWFCLVLGVVGIFLIDSNILYYSGLHISPVALEHAEGADQLIVSKAIFLVFLPLLFIGTILAAITKKILSSHKVGTKKYYVTTYAFIVLTAIAGIFILSSLKQTPELAILKSFLKEEEGGLILPDTLKEKLKKFGINYDYDKFKLVNREKIYSTSTVYLPNEFKNKKPNIIIFFLESYSARLSSVYDPKFPGLSPGLEEMAKDKNTTVFHGLYNATTPTAPALLSLLCSFYPPTSHYEISEKNELTGHRLMCLPEVLKKQAGYKYARYVANVNKSYSHKDSMFKFMDVDEVVGAEELSKEISGKSLSWGYSDHQVGPVFFKYAEDLSSHTEPFLLMWSTVDTHPPFNLAKDAVKYGDGKNDLLNAFHTTDDAFLEFWQKFKNSSMYNDTILVAVADHAVFPAEQTRQTFPEVNQYNYFDETVFQMYIPGNILPKKVERISSGVDFTPTLLHILGVNVPNSFEGYSIFDGREKYPNLLGMHDLGFYINEVGKDDKRSELFSISSQLKCDLKNNEEIKLEVPLTLCELKRFFLWKKEQFRQGRFWKPGA